jgi:hypothetical protein
MHAIMAACHDFGGVHWSESTWQAVPITLLAFGAGNNASGSRWCHSAVTTQHIDGGRRLQMTQVEDREQTRRSCPTGEAGITGNGNSARRALTPQRRPGSAPTLNCIGGDRLVPVSTSAISPFGGLISIALFFVVIFGVIVAALSSVPVTQEASIQRINTMSSLSI